jgi:hypothetical protein
MVRSRSACYANLRMNQPLPPSPPGADPLAELLQREFGQSSTPQERMAARPHPLEPITLPPPPGGDGASPEDDIELDPVGDAERRRQLVIAGGGIGLALIAALTGWLVMGAFKSGPVVNAPVIRAEPEALKAPPPPSPETDTRSAGGASELTAPNTDGFSPAKRVATQRIVVENDREVPR